MCRRGDVGRRWRDLNRGWRRRREAIDGAGHRIEVVLEIGDALEQAIAVGVQRFDGVREPPRFALVDRCELLKLFVLVGDQGIGSQ